jgi:hypothetical protein
MVITNHIRQVNLKYLAYAPQPNWAFNADANTGHGFAIFMASVGALLTLALGFLEPHPHVKYGICRCSTASKS